MSGFDGIFDGLLGYEKLMLLCGFILFVFALLAITVMIVQRRDFKAAVLLIVVAIVLMGFPGIQAVKFSKGIVEIDRIRTQSTGTTDPAQQQQDQQLLGDMQERAADNPQLLAKVSDAYRAIGEVNKAYDLASSVLREKPSVAVQQTLIPVLTAKLNQVQQGSAPASSPTSVPAPTQAKPAIPHAGSVASAAPVAPPTAAAPSPAPTQAQPPATVAASPPATGAARGEIAAIARQLQAVAAPLPASSRIALANAYVKLGDSQQARTNVEQARKLSPQLKLSPALERALQSSHESVH